MKLLRGRLSTLCLASNGTGNEVLDWVKAGAREIQFAFEWHLGLGLGWVGCS